MAGTVSVFKTLIIPAVIALLVFLLITYLVLPLWQRYRNRYSQYLPLDAISNQTSSLRQRIQGGITRFMLPSAWRQRIQDRLVVATDGGLDGDFDSEDGEELDEVDEDRRQLSRDSDRPDMTRRLSRDLEQGFMDDSDEETPGR